LTAERKKKLEEGGRTLFNQMRREIGIISLSKRKGNGDIGHYSGKEDLIRKKKSKFSS